ncbi:MAG TPA: WG repeat-containing protein, partial [Blastocatellia bacterium]|nr:WG repeat-containing protein [Blastocatellia bacterium]
GVEPFSDGLALVNAGTLTRRNFGFIDRSGKMVITPRYLDAESFTEGVACVGLVNEKGFKFGYIDKTGAFVIKPQFDSAASFSEGYAPVSNGVNVSLIQKKSLQAYRCTCSYDPSNEPQGLFIRPPPGDAGVEPDEDEHGTAALIGKDGQPLLKPDHRDLGQFSEGLAPVQFSDGWGYIDTSATVVIAPQFAAAECFANGLARVRTDANGVAFINHQGKVVWKSGK